ncbi:MAG TPA: hypothetical protein G4O11_11075 [Anaerolineae bacterium]|nr:hypothetical protein [Anaerolineae bacterium]
MQQARRKRHRRYLFYRAYCVTFALGWNVVGIWQFVVMQNPPVVLLVLLPFVIPALFMLFNLMAWRFAFSVFGAYERSQAPAEPPLEQLRATSGAIGLLFGTSPFFTWTLYEGGIGVSVLGIGAGYVPLDRFVEVRISRRGCTIRHNSSEVRSPLDLPPGKLSRHLNELWDEYRGAQTQCRV